MLKWLIEEDHNVPYHLLDHLFSSFFTLYNDTRLSDDLTQNADKIQSRVDWFSVHQSLVHWVITNLTIN